MTEFEPNLEIQPRVLATDLDGTLIPLTEQPECTEALTTLKRLHEAHAFGLIFATGRHFESVLDAIEQYRLPRPDWIICDVGSSIYRRVGKDFTPFLLYETHLGGITGTSKRAAVESLLSGMDHLRPQAEENQSDYKISYQSTPEAVEGLVRRIRTELSQAKLPYDCMGSVDPFLKIGLIDILPEKVSKAYALIWLATHGDYLPDEIIYSGDSGNDLAALVAGFRAIIVANASTGLADQVSAAHQKRNLKDRVYQAPGDATLGVLQGCRHFGLFAES